MARIPDRLRWDSELSFRHMILIAAVMGLLTVFWNTLRIESISALMSVLFFVSMAAVLGFIARAPKEEIATVGWWSVLGVVAYLVLGILYRGVVGSNADAAEFLTTHPGGTELFTIGAVSIVLFSITLLRLVPSVLRQRRNRPATPEEAILSDVEYEEFKPDPSRRRTTPGF